MAPNISLRTAILLSIALLAVALAAGTSSAVFLWLLEEVTRIHSHTPWLVVSLPVVGALVGWLYHWYGRGIENGTDVLYGEVHQPSPSNRIPLRMAPMVLIGTLLTHLGGGSAGREGTAVQMSGALTESIAGLFTSLHRFRRHILLLGVSAGFGSVFGTPIAGAIFALEIVPLPLRMRLRMAVPVLAVGYLAHGVCLAWGIHHTPFPRIEFGAPFMSGLWAVVVGVVASAVAFAFHRMKGGIGRLLAQHVRVPWIRPVVGGCVVSAFIIGFDLRDHSGLSIPLMLVSFSAPVVWYAAIVKVGLTALTLGSGYKGGEVTPLFVMGALMGSALAGLGFEPGPMAAMGMVAVFSAATRTPVASAVMACEVFGWGGLPWYAIACSVAWAVEWVYERTARNQ